MMLDKKLTEKTQSQLRHRHEPVQARQDDDGTESDKGECEERGRSRPSVVFAEEVEGREDMAAQLLERNELVQILVEIVGATNLVKPSPTTTLGGTLSSWSKSLSSRPSAANSDTNSCNEPTCNPYCEVTHMGKVVHRTNTVIGDNHPVWDMLSKSLFVVHARPKQLVTNGLCVTLYDDNEASRVSLCGEEREATGSGGVSGGNNGNRILPSLASSPRGKGNDKTPFSARNVIGSVCVSPSILLGHCDETRLEFDLTLAEEKDEDKNTKTRDERVKKICTTQKTIAARDDKEVSDQSHNSTYAPQNHNGGEPSSARKVTFDTSSMRQRRRPARSERLRIGRGSVAPLTPTISQERMVVKTSQRCVTGDGTGNQRSKREVSSRGVESNLDADDDADADVERSEMVTGTVALRFRVATVDDVKFLRYLSIKQSIEERRGGGVLPRSTLSPHVVSDHLVTETEERTDAVAPSLSRALNGARRRADEMVGGARKFRVKPRPDVGRWQETEHMTKKAMEVEMLKESTNWIEAGSNLGSVGRVYLEVLRCKDLPNMDVGEAFGRLTDAFVCIVYEDAIVQSDVIGNCLSPMWMPWTRRAFEFHTMHPLSRLYIAVLDYDGGSMANHDPIGRVVVNLTRFQPRTVYTLQYKIHKSCNVTNRQSFGVIKIRLRIELDDERSHLLSSIQKLPRCHINVQKEKTFKVALFTCYGTREHDTFDLQLLQSYIDEIVETQSVVFFLLKDALMSLIFWRGQVQVFSCQYPPLPVYSALVFCMAMAVIERPQILPSIFFFSIAMSMLATMEYRRRHPSPWMRCKTFLHYLSVLCETRDYIGVDNGVSKSICPNEGAEEAADLREKWKHRVEAGKNAFEKRCELENELREQMAKVSNDSIQTPNNDWPDVLTTLLPVLLTVQDKLGGVVWILRICKTIISWEESTAAFWITLLSFTVGVLLLLVPWPFLLYSLCKLSIYLFLGPWMKLVDIYIRNNLSIDLMDEDAHEIILREMMLSDFLKKSRAARLVGEDAVQLKAARAVRFGDYSMRVPSWNIVRYYDHPLSESTAQPAKHSSKVEGGSKKDHKFILGQKLTGKMIPRPNSYLPGHDRESLLREKARLECLKVVADD